MVKGINVGYFIGEEVNFSQIEKLSKVDVAVFILKKFSFVSVKDELDNKTDNFVKMAEISKKLNGVVLFSLITDTFGTIRQSVAAFKGGTLDFIADCNRGNSKFTGGYGYKSVGSKNIGKIGVAVGKDILDFQCIKTLSLCQNDAIINLSADVFDFSAKDLFSSLAYLSGMPIVTINKNKVVFCDAFGKVLLSSNEGFGIFFLPYKKRFSQITIKNRGV